MHLRTPHRPALAWLLGLVLMASSGWAVADPPSRVARLGYISGTVSFSPAGEDDWVRATVNRPLGSGDRLWSQPDSRAEVQVGGAMLRMSADTAVSVLNLDDQITQLQLTQGNRDLRLRQGRQPGEQFFGAFQTEAIDRHLKVFRRFGHAAMGVAIGFANHAQGQRRAVLYQFGDIAQGAAIVGDGLADTVMTGLRNRQAHAIEKLDPAFESGRFWNWNVRFVSHVWTLLYLSLRGPNWLFA